MFTRWGASSDYVIIIEFYVQDFSTIVLPLYALLKKDVAWTWSDEAQEAFDTLKEKLSKFPILRRPDFNKVFILHTDWSAFGIEAILGQLDEEGKEYVIWRTPKSRVEPTWGSNYVKLQKVRTWGVLPTSSTNEG